MAFTGLYLPRDSIIHKLDARVKLVWFILAFAASIASQWDGSVSVFVYASLIVGLTLAKISIKRAALIVAYSIVFFVVTVLVWASMYQGVGTYLWTFPLANIRITDVGLLVGLGKFFLIVNPITAFLLLVTTTKMYDLVQVFTRMGVPYKVGYMFMLAFGLLPYTLMEFKNVIDVQRARGIPVDSKNPVKRIVYTVPVFVPVIIRMLSYAWDLSVVLNVRGFGASKNRTFYFSLKWSSRDTVAVVVLVVLYVLLIALKLTGFSTYYYVVKALGE
ncbi:MAG: energy-coupling factor transporter transmembrane component T [Desulfurococcaceae archaeon]